MRKIVIVFVVCCLLSSLGYVTFRLTQDEPTLKLGIGVVVSASATDAVAAQGENPAKNGKGSADITVAAVLVDKDGNIVKAVVDVMQLALEYTPEGKAISNAEFKSKHELGDDYGMKAPWGSEKEWYEHANAFCEVIAGKNIDQVKALIKDNSEVQNAGCTIYAGDFVSAVEKAMQNAKASDATAKHTLKVGMSVAQSVSDATSEANGKNAADTTFVAAVLDGETLVAVSSDAVSVSFGFTNAGKSTFDNAAAIKTKHELGDDYGMKSPWGSEKEWYEHANAFDAACAGKTVAEVSGIVGADGKATDPDLLSAGCTIAIGDFVKALGKLQG